MLNNFHFEHSENLLYSRISGKWDLVMAREYLRCVSDESERFRGPWAFLLVCNDWQPSNEDASGYAQKLVINAIRQGLAAVAMVAADSAQRRRLENLLNALQGTVDIRFFSKLADAEAWLQLQDFQL